MDKAIMKNYNGTVTDDDEVYFVGDITMRGPIHKESIRQIIGRMKGQKHLILGNHDRLHPFDYVDMGLGDGLYEFEAVATNNLGEKEPRNGQSEASIIVDIADIVHAENFLPQVSTTGVTQ